MAVAKPSRSRRRLDNIPIPLACERTFERYLRSGLLAAMLPQRTTSACAPGRSSVGLADGQTTIRRAHPRPHGLRAQSPVFEAIRRSQATHGSRRAARRRVQGRAAARAEDRFRLYASVAAETQSRRWMRLPSRMAPAFNGQVCQSGTERPGTPRACSFACIAGRCHHSGMPASRIPVISRF
jgi:hypothetical protein